MMSFPLPLPAIGTPFGNSGGSNRATGFPSSNDDFLARSQSSEQFRQLSLGFFDGDGGHCGGIKR
jgi:hypothetical protein